MPVAVNVTDSATPSDGYLSSPTEMARALLYVATAAIAQSGPLPPPEDLLETEVVKRGQKGNILGETAAYELRYTCFRFTQSGFLGKVTDPQLRYHAGLQYDHYMANLRATQPNVKWGCVAARVFHEDIDAVRKTHLVGVPSMAGLAQLMAMDEEMADGRGVMPTGGSTRSAPHKVKEKRMYLEVAIAGLDQGDLRDPYTDRGEGVAGGMHKYLETGWLRHLPLPLQKDRAEAVRVIASNHPEVLAPKPEPEPASAVRVEVTEEDLRSYYFRRQAGEPWSDIAPGQDGRSISQRVRQWAKRHPELLEQAGA